jgi:dTMP kinase
MKSLLRRGGFRTLLFGQGISALGDWMGTIALMALVREQSGSSTAVGGILVLRLMPAAIGGPLATRVAQRWDRRRTMLAMDLARAGMVALVPLIGALWWTYLWAFLLEVCSIVFLPARDASLPDLASEDLPLANGLILGSSYGTIPLGAVAFFIAAALPTHVFGLPTASHHNFALAFWIDAATFLVSFALIRRITALQGAAAAHAAAAAEAQTHARFVDAFRIPLVRAVLPATVTVAVGVGALFSVGIVFVREVLDATDAQFGALIALFGVGAGIGLASLQWRRDSDLLAAVRAGVALQGATIATMSLAPSVPWAFLGAGMFGLSASYTLAAGMSVLQSRLDGDERVQAFTVFHVVIRGGLTVAALGAGIAADLVNSVSWPVLGHLEPARVVLFSAGALVFFSMTLVREGPPRRASAKGRLWDARRHRH